MTGLVVGAGGDLQFDDAGYLTRGFYHAAQVEAKGNLFYLRLPWSLRFEAPKPPLYTGFLAILAHWLPWTAIPWIVGLATAVPLSALLAGAILLARRAAGARAAPLAICALLSMPLLLSLSARLLVETTLAALVVWAAWLALARSERRSLAFEAGLGVVVGLALLAKLLAPLFVGPVLLVAWITVVRREGWAAALRFAAITGLTALAVAALWYQRNFLDALAYAGEASHPAHSLDAGRPWTRPFRLVVEAFGAPFLAVVAALVPVALRVAGRADAGLRRLRWMALSAAAASALVIVQPPVFDPRFWAPATALVAIWAAAEVAGRWGAMARGGRIAVVAVAATAVGWSAWSVARIPRWSTPWALSGILDELAGRRDRPLRLCTMGAHPTFNIGKVRLVAEWSRLRPRPVSWDVLHRGLPDDVGAAVADCDLLFVLDPREILPLHTQQLVNVDLHAAYGKLQSGTGDLRPSPDLGRRLQVPVTIEVYRRAGSLEPFSTGH